MSLFRNPPARTAGLTALSAALNSTPQGRGQFAMYHALSATDARQWPRRARTRTRRGAVIVELALVLPLIVFLVLATIDATTMVFLNHTLTIAAYEGTRVAIQPDGTTAAATAQTNSVLTARAVAGTSVSVNPADVQSVSPGTPITVTASATCDANTLIPTLFYSGKTLTATCTMVKE
jgi:Flp pilus assembly protein TadG